MRKLSALIASLTLLLAGTAGAEDHHVSQKGQQFAPQELSVRVGDRLVFHNDDDITHNVYSKSEGSEFNVRLQQPGSESPVVMERTGTVDVRCAIHPKMKLRIEVKE
jgi:plastocyanin